MGPWVRLAGGRCLRCGCQWWLLRLDVHDIKMATRWRDHCARGGPATLLPVPAATASPVSGTMSAPPLSIAEPVGALQQAGQQSFEVEEFGASERAFTAALGLLPPPPAPLTAGHGGAGGGEGEGVAGGRRCRAELHVARCETRLRLGLLWGALDDCEAALQLDPTITQAQAQRELVLRELEGGGRQEKERLGHSVAKTPLAGVGGVAAVACWLDQDDQDPEELQQRQLLRGGGGRGAGVGGSGVPPAATPEEQATATGELQAAASTGRLDVATLRRLLRAGAALGRPDGAGRTALRLALVAGQHRVVRLLLDYCYRELRLRQRLVRRPLRPFGGRSD
jgi:hypothetical protein